MTVFQNLGQTYDDRAELAANTWRYGGIWDKHITVLWNLEQILDSMVEFWERYDGIAKFGANVLRYGGIWGKNMMLWWNLGETYDGMVEFGAEI